MVETAVFAVTLDLARFLALVRRELGAEEASVLGPDELAAPIEDGRELRCSVPDGRVVVARFDEPPADREAKLRHLEMLASTFDAVVEEAPRGSRSRAPAGRSLQDELQTLCERASALNALVIDANSPVVWGAAQTKGVVPDAPDAPVSPEASSQGTATTSDITSASLRALRAVRALVESAGLRKGKRVRHVERAGEAPFLAHSFAGIYLLLLVFPAPFDELRAERAMLESMQRIERLVLALPPFDPPPDMGAGVIAIRRSRRR